MVYIVFTGLQYAYKGNSNPDSLTVQEILPQETKMTKEGIRVLSGYAPYLINMMEAN